jgi:hypothetical protein
MKDLGGARIGRDVTHDLGCIADRVNAGVGGIDGRVKG